MWSANLQLSTDNQLRNGALDQLDDDARPEHWTIVSGNATFDVVTTNSPSQGQAPALRVRIPAGGSVVLSQDAPVEDDAEYLFAAQVRSEGDHARVVAQVDQLTMSYNDLGQWQRVMGLVTATRTESRTVRLELRALDDEPATVLLRDVSLRRSERPSSVNSRPSHGPTTLVERGTIQTYIVYGSNQADIAEPLARRMQAAIEQRVGARVPVRSDKDVTDAHRPVLRDSYRDAHLVLIGRLGTNRAIWPAYNRFLSAVDDYYPGGDGHVVRTAANVFANGRNHLIVGASNDAGLERAAEVFIARLDDATVDQQEQTLTLPWLLDVELGGEALEAMQARDALWREDPHHRLLPRVEPGYGTVRRWYENAMGYYWSGWESFRQRAVEHLEPVLADRAYTHHYIVEFLVRTYTMLDDSDLINDEQRAQLDHLILTNFLDFLTEGRDLGWMTTFAPPYENIAISNRHQIAPWTGDAMMADFLHQHLEWGEALGELIAFRRDEKHRFFEHVLAHRWRPSGAATAGHYEEMAAAMLRYALHHERYEFFESGHARRALPLDRIDHRTGTLVQPRGNIDHHLVLGILAHYYQDGRYTWLRDRLPLTEHATGPFQGRYVAGVRRYSPGDAIAPVEPSDWAGVGVTPLSAHDRYMIGRLGSGLFRRPAFDTDKAMDLLTFREGFRPEHDYVAVTGLQGPDALPGIFVNFTSGGHGWLSSEDVNGFGPVSDRYFDQNGVSVIRTDRWLEESEPFTAAAQLTGLVNLEHSGAGELHLEPVMDTAWSRRVVQLRPGLYVVRDTVTALEPGEYQIRVNWRPAGTPRWDGEAWISEQGDQRFRLTPMGERFHVDQNVDAFLKGQTDTLQFGHAAQVTLDPGESVTATTLIEVAPQDQAPLRARLIDHHHLLLSRGADGDDGMHVVFDGLDNEELRTDAGTLIVRPGELTVMQATRFHFAGRALLEADTPVSFRVDAEQEQARFDPGEGEPLRFTPGDADGQLDAQLGEHVRTFAVVDDVLEPLWQRLAAHMTEHVDEAATPGSAVTDDTQAIEDTTAAWHVAWTYDGLKRPQRIHETRRVAEQVVDLGRTVVLDEIRARRLASGPWQPSPLPDEFWAAEPDPETGGMPPLESDAWQRLPEPQWRPGVRTGNYGEAHPAAQSHQIVRAGGVRARYVRAERAHLWIYYAADVQRSREPVRLELHDVTGDGRQGILAATDVSSDWPRERIEEDAALALLDGDGREQFTHDPEVNMQALRVLDFDGGGEKKVVVVTWDGRIRIFNPDGSLWHDLDLYQMHQDFQRREGRDDTRHPAGGYVTPYGFGLWDPEGSGERRMIIPRYGRFSFIDGEGEFEGVLNAVGYAKRGVLPYGIDFSGDGREEQLALERFRVVHVDGEPVPYVPDPTGREFYPQIHQQSWLRQPDSPRNLAGAPVLLFDSIAWNAEPSPRYVLIVRESFLGIYDGKERDWAFTWVPLVALSAATVVRDEYDRLCVAAITRDGLLWQLDWQNDLNELASFDTMLLPEPVSNIASARGERDPLWMAGANGIYQLRADGSMSRIANGAFYDVQPMHSDDEAAEVIIVTTAEGAVQRIERNR